MVIEARQPRSKRDAGDVVLNETIDVDNGGGVTELDASDKYEDERQHRVDGVQHVALSSFSMSHL